MDFILSNEQRLIQKMMREFTENEVKPVAAELDLKHEYPAENVEKLFKLGVMAMTVPKEYGGAGVDQVSAAICTEELAKACGVSRQTINAIENNKYDPTLALAFHLAKTLGTTVDELFTPQA